MQGGQWGSEDYQSPVFSTILSTNYQLFNTLLTTFIDNFNTPAIFFSFLCMTSLMIRAHFSHCLQSSLLSMIHLDGYVQRILNTKDYRLNYRLFGKTQKIIDYLANYRLFKQKN